MLRKIKLILYPRRSLSIWQNDPTIAEKKVLNHPWYQCPKARNCQKIATLAPLWLLSTWASDPFGGLIPSISLGGKREIDFPNGEMVKWQKRQLRNLIETSKRWKSEERASSEKVISISFATVSGNGRITLYPILSWEEGQFSIRYGVRFPGFPDRFFFWRVFAGNITPH